MVRDESCPNINLAGRVVVVKSICGRKVPIQVVFLDGIKEVSLFACGKNRLSQPIFCDTSQGLDYSGHEAAATSEGFIPGDELGTDIFPGFN